MIKLINSHLERHEFALRHIRDIADLISRAGEVCTGALMANKKILICGNGGSAADAQHMAAELVGRFIKDRPALAAVALTTDTSALTAIANDYGYDSVFSRQVAGLGNEGDVLLAISTSGQSKSIIQACHKAREIGCEVIGLAGRSGGDLSRCCDVPLVIPVEETAHIQECHIIILHMLCTLIEHGLNLA